MFGPMALAASALVASLATLLAGSLGVNSVATLPWGRHTCAMGAGVAAGWAMLAALVGLAVAWFGDAFATWRPRGLAFVKKSFLEMGHFCALTSIVRVPSFFTFAM